MIEAVTGLTGEAEELSAGDVTCPNIQNCRIENKPLGGGYPHLVASPYKNALTLDFCVSCRILPLPSYVRFSWWPCFMVRPII
jgi:hypothetical protein